MDLIAILSGAIAVCAGLIVAEKHSRVLGLPLLVIGIVIFFWGLIKNHKSHTRK